MQRYMVRRLLLIVPNLLLMGTLLFFMLNVVPGDMALAMVGGSEAVVDPQELERLRRELGLDQPLVVRYGKWLGQTVRGDLGYSYFFRRPVHDALLAKIEVTASLTLLAVTLAMLFAVPLGVVSALFRGGLLDQGIRVWTAAGLALPNFWLAIIVLLLLVRTVHWVPPMQHASLFDDPLRALQRLWLPALIIGFRQAAAISRMTRSMMLEVLGQDYVRTARAKGLRPATVIMTHAFRNALLPVVTMGGLLVMALIEGAVVIERIFTLPGMGMQLVEGVQARDFTMVLGLMMAIGAFAMLWILVIDLAYGILDPRVRYE